MKNVYIPWSKSGPHTVRGPIQSGRVPALGDLQITKWRRPCTKKTAAELLHQDDEKPGTLTTKQRRYLEKRAGDNYKKIDPSLKRPTESIDEYVERINKMMVATR